MNGDREQKPAILIKVLYMNPIGSNGHSIGQQPAADLTVMDRTQLWKKKARRKASMMQNPARLGKLCSLHVLFLQL